MRRVAAGLNLALCMVQACAQSWPARPIRMIVPALAGSAADVRGRWVADRLAVALKQPVTLDFRAGAGGSIGTEAGARSPPDGYTLLFVHQGTLAINPHLYARPGYDALADFAPVTRVSQNPFLLASAMNLPAKSIGELMRLAQERPGELTFGSPGNGTPPHLAGELFARVAGIKVRHVPYKSGSQTITDLIAGHIGYSFDTLAIQLPHVKAGKVRALATTAAQRSAAVPDAPTLAESGLRDFEYVSWMGVVVPAATPRPIVERLNAEILAIMRTPETRDWLAAQGAEPGLDTPEEFAAVIRAEHAKLGRVIRDAGIRIE